MREDREGRDAELRALMGDRDDRVVSRLVSVPPTEEELEAVARDREEMTHRFSYHPPRSDDEIMFYKRCRAMMRTDAYFLVENLPPSRARSQALTALEDAVMYANKACALGGLRGAGVDLG